MGDTAHKTEAEKEEFFDAPEILDEKISLLAELILSSEHFVAFTGAGISTAAGIPDFRSGVKTVLPTGPGAWERKATGYTKPAELSVSTLCAIPTRTHMSFVALERCGLLKGLISQNTDGLHRRSGFPTEKLAELHGNTNLEICKSCKKQYMRDYWTRTAKAVFKHETGSKCENCGNQLFDTIVNFGEQLPEREIDFGFEQAQFADLHLCLGSSLRVSPANQMPETTIKKPEGKLVIVNLQPTPLDDVATVRIWGLCDVVMDTLMKKLNIDIPEFTLTRYVGIKQNKGEISIRGVDADYSAFSFLKKIVVNNTLQLKQEPFLFRKSEKYLKESVEILFHFMGHYKEPELKLDILLSELPENKERFFAMEFSPKEKKWVSVYERL